MKINRSTTGCLLTIALVILVVNIIPWGFVLKILLILGVIYFALNMHSDSSEKFFGQKQSDGFSGIVQDNGSASHPVRRYVFSDSVIDLTDSGILPEQLEIQAAFSRVIVRLPVDANIIVQASGALCSISIPGRQSVILGQCTHHCGTQDPRAPRLYINASCALGQVAFRMG